MPRTPVMFCPGNHDVRSDFWSAILDRDGGETPVNVLYRTGRMAVAMLDTSVPGRGEGYLDDETLEWLDKTLTGVEDNVPVFVGFHHPPVRLHSDYVDPIRQYGGERFGDVLARHRVAGLLCGHVHTAAVTRFGGIPLIAAGGVVNTVLAGWEADTIPTFDTDQPPVVAFHVYDSADRLTTHFRVVV